MYRCRDLHNHTAYHINTKQEAIKCIPKIYIKKNPVIRQTISQDAISFHTVTVLKKPEHSEREVNKKEKNTLQIFTDICPIVRPEASNFFNVSCTSRNSFLYPASNPFPNCILLFQFPMSLLQHDILYFFPWKIHTCPQSLTGYLTSADSIYI